MTERLKVYLNGIQAGFLAWDSELDVFSFSYLPDYLGRDKAVPISKSFPLKDEAFGPLVSRAFFENLLPPEVVRRKLEKILHHDRRNTFAFLKELGGDCAGAISLCPEAVELGSADDLLDIADSGHYLSRFAKVSFDLTMETANTVTGIEVTLYASSSSYNPDVRPITFKTVPNRQHIEFYASPKSDSTSVYIKGIRITATSSESNASYNIELANIKVQDCSQSSCSRANSGVVS